MRVSMVAEAALRGIAAGCAGSRRTGKGVRQVDRRVDRRQILKARHGRRGLALWTFPRMFDGATGGFDLADKLAVVDGGGSNVLAFSAADGLVLVDSGAPKSGDKVMAGTWHLEGTDPFQHPLPPRSDG